MLTQISKDTEKKLIKKQFIFNLQKRGKEEKKNREFYLLKISVDVALLGLSGDFCSASLETQGF